MPAAIAACRAGFWPCAAVSTWPRITSETSLPATPACVERRLDRDPAQFVRGHRGEGAEEATDRAYAWQRL